MTCRHRGAEDEYLIPGRCCACGKDGPMRNIMMLHVKASIPGTGWGCVVCGLSSDGALAVVCDPCAAAGTPIVEACSGYLLDGERVPLASLTTPFDHDTSRHPELQGP